MMKKYIKVSQNILNHQKQIRLERDERGRVTCEVLRTLNAPGGFIDSVVQPED